MFSVACAAQFHRVYRASQFVEYVCKRTPWVASGHTWTGLAHKLTNLLALLFFVAMDGALGAGRFGLAIGALGEALFRILH